MKKNNMDTSKDLEKLEQKLREIRAHKKTLGLNWVLFVVFVIFSIYALSYYVQQSIKQAIANEDIPNLVEAGIQDGFEGALQEFKVPE